MFEMSKFKMQTSMFEKSKFTMPVNFNIWSQNLPVNFNVWKVKIYNACKL